MKKLSIFSIFAMLLLSSSMVYGQESASQRGQSMMDEASEAVSHVESVISEGQDMLREAQADSDISRMDCLNAQLINARGFLNVVQNGEANLRDAVSRNDTAAQQHHYKLVQLAVSKTDTISAKMSECVTGVLGDLSGETRQDTQRVCSIEPCLGGEEYFEPALKTEVSLMKDSVVDASPYL